MLSHNKREAKTLKDQMKTNLSQLENTQVPTAVMDDPLIKEFEKK